MILSGFFIWIFNHYLAEPNYLSKCENFPYFVIGSGAEDCVTVLMDPVNPVLLGQGRWLTGDASGRASEETGVQVDPVQARLDELLRRLESLGSGLKKLPSGRQMQQNRSDILKTMLGGMEMIIGLTKAGANAGTIGRMRLGATPSQRIISRLCPRGLETQNSFTIMSLMFSCTGEAGTQVLIASLFLH